MGREAIGESERESAVGESDKESDCSAIHKLAYPIIVSIALPPEG